MAKRPRLTEKAPAFQPDLSGRGPRKTYEEYRTKRDSGALDENERSRDQQKNVLDKTNVIAIKPEDNNSETFKMVVTTLEGLEPILAEELRLMGAEMIEIGSRAVICKADKKFMYRCNLELRTAIRVLKSISNFRMRHESALYTKIREIDWSQYLDVDGTLAINAVCFSKYFTHSQYIALKSKDAIVDQFRDNFGRRPNVDTVRPKLRVNIYVHDDECEVLLDSSSDPLFKRGYRSETLEAPINEVLAAGMLKLAGYDGHRALIDPMCGSGTILTEAALIAYNIPPQLHRSFFGFTTWNDFDPKLWKTVIDEAKTRIIKEKKAPILGFDKDFQAIRISERNSISEEMSGRISFERKDINKLEPPVENAMIVTNPPYDERLEVENIQAFYGELGDIFKRKFTGYDVWMISSNEEAFKKFGLRPSQKYKLNNGGLDCKFMKFELYHGSKKASKQVVDNEEIKLDIKNIIANITKKEVVETEKTEIIEVPTIENIEAVTAVLVEETQVEILETPTKAVEIISVETEAIEKVVKKTTKKKAEIEPVVEPVVETEAIEKVVKKTTKKKAEIEPIVEIEAIEKVVKKATKKKVETEIDVKAAKKVVKK